MRTPALRTLPLPALVWLAIAGPCAAHAASVPAAAQRVPLKPGQDPTAVALQDYYTADKSLRVQYTCDDENLPGGANEGASNPANVHCEAALFTNRAGKWVFADEVRLGQGRVKGLQGQRLTVETVGYGIGDALCCPSDKETLIFNLGDGKFEEDLAAEGKPPLVKLLEDGATMQEVTALLARGANVNTYDATGRTPLMAAIEQRQIDVVRLLLERGAHVNARRGDGLTPLALATVYGEPDIAKLLLAHGADPKARDSDGYPLLLMVVTPRNVDLLRAFLEHGARPDTRSTEGVTPLVAAVRVRAPDAVRILLDHGASPDFPDASGETPLMAATTGHNAEMIPLLLGKGASPEVKDAQGRTALMLAVLRGNVEVASALLAGGANPDTRDTTGDTPLLALAGYELNLPATLTGQLMTLLLDHRADINARTRDGDTALLLLALNQRWSVTLPHRYVGPYNPHPEQARAPDNADLVKLLVDRGADVTLMNTRRQNALSAYATTDCTMMTYLLQKDSGRGSSGHIDALLAASRAGKLECVRALLASGVNVNARATPHGETPLIAAATGGDLETVRFLLAHGADPSLKAATRFPDPLRLLPGYATDPKLEALRRSSEETAYTAAVAANRAPVATLLGHLQPHAPPPATPLPLTDRVDLDRLTRFAALGALLAAAIAGALYLRRRIAN